MQVIVEGVKNNETSQGCGKNSLKASNSPKGNDCEFSKTKESGFKVPIVLNDYLSMFYPRVNQRYSQTVQTIVFRKNNSQCASSSGTKSKVKAKLLRKKKKTMPQKHFIHIYKILYIYFFVFFFFQEM